ncbi:MAG: AMP-binding protein [Planctomycetaceae bacterium]|nr:AMP-binding protein [Planctomycetaceae bacterium]
MGAGGVVGRVLDLADADPARPCIAFVDANGAFDWIDRQSFVAAARVAEGALCHSGLREGGVLLLVSVDPRECATLVLAALFAGARPLLVAPPSIQGVQSSLTAILRNVLERTRADVAVLPPNLHHLVGELTTTCPGTRLVLGAEQLLAGRAAEGPRQTPPDPVPPLDTDIGLLQLTSGTTGFPRIATWRHDALLSALDGMAAGMGLREDDVYLNWTPLYHDMGLVNNFLLCQALGVPLALLSPLDVVKRPALWVQALATTRATTTWSPNFGFALAAERVQEADLEGVRLDHVRGIWNAAERVHLATMERFLARFGPLGLKREALRTNFGCVETIGGVTFSAARTSLRAERVDLKQLGVGAVVRTLDDGVEGARVQSIVGLGPAYPGAELAVFDESGERLAEGHVGAIGVCAAGTFSGYWGDDDASRDARAGAFVLTGDEGYLRDGELFWTGRRKERINLQGRKYDPSEFERTLDAVAGIRPGCFVAFGREDPPRGTEGLVLLAEVVPMPPAELPDVAARVRRAVAVGHGLTIDVLWLMEKGALTKTSSGKRRHLHFRGLFLADRLAPLFRAP